MMNLSMSLSE